MLVKGRQMPVRGDLVFYAGRNTGVRESERKSDTSLHRGFPKQMRTARIKETHLEVLAGQCRLMLLHQATAVTVEDCGRCAEGVATAGKTGFVSEVLK